MKLSCLPVSFFSQITSGKMSLAEWARIGASIGLDAIDLSILFVPDHSPEALRRIRAQIENEGMHIAMITSYPDFTHPQADQRHCELDLEIEVVDVAGQLGAELVRVTAGQAHPQTGRQQGIEWASEGLTRLVEATRGWGVTLVYENHAKPGAWVYTDFSQPPEIFLEIVQRTAPVGLGINFDTGNAVAFATDPLAMLDQVIERVVSVHASDTAMRGSLQHVLLGTGVTPYAEIFARLRAYHWEGWICIEEGSGLGYAGVETAARFIRQTWDDAATTNQ